MPKLNEHPDLDGPETVSSSANGPPNTKPPAPSAAVPDPFDPESLRLTGDALAGIGVKKALLTVPVRKPDRSWFVRTNPDPTHRYTTAAIELKDDREGTYLVQRDLWPMLAAESMFRPIALFTAINRQGVIFLWTVKLPGADGRADEWGKSALEAADRSARQWVRVQANMALGAYEVWEANGDIPEPEWPAQSFGDLLKIAFKDRFISTPDHPVLRKLRGDV